MKEKEPKKIIVRMPNWIGDLAMATPVLSDLRKKFPKAEITAMCRHPLGDLLKEDKDIDELFTFRKLPNGFARREERRNIIEKLKDGHYDLGILLTNSFSSAWLFWQGKVKRRIGYSKHLRSLLLTDSISPPKEKEHQVKLYKRLLLPLGIETSATEPRFYLTKEEKENAKEILYQRGYEKGKKLIGIHPGAAYGEAKCWPSERYKKVAERLLEENQDLYVVFFGDANTFPLIKSITQNMGKRAINLAGVTSLRELACIIDVCSLLVTNDSGPMHIASALAVPTVAIFGSTDQVVTGPYKNGTIINKNVSCSPCLKRKCPIDFRCMMQISVEEVLQVIYKVLQNVSKTH
jgi:heptosyltransferase II